MKKLAAWLLAGCLAFTGWKWAVDEYGLQAQEGPVVDARASILMDAETGRVLHASHADEALPPASMSKMMTELVLLELLDKGTIAWEEQVTVSRYAADVEGAEIGARAGDRFKVRELFEAMTVHSANDAAIALAEHAAGSELKFAAWMNDRARKIGLSEGTYFANATGLSSADLAMFEEAAADGDTVMTARDTARLAAYLIREYPQVLDITTLRDVAVDGGNASLVLRTTNQMLPGEAYAYKGNDGLKTGFTSRAGYCFAGTTQRGGKRLIAVVMGAATSEARFTETKKLFQYGYGAKQDPVWIAQMRALLP
jgi:D-alanyl-D-alanine carboxypeptidase